MAKQVIHGEESRAAILRGVTPALHEVDERLTLRGLAEAWKILSGGQ